jgi:hypothetical protein
MRRVLSSLTAALILTAASAASAGGYVGLGFGSDASLSGDIADHYTADGETAGKFFLGQRFGAFAIEASFFGTDMTGISDRTRFSGTDQYSTASVGIDVKYHMGLVGPIEGYLRGGLNKTWIGAASGEQTDLDYSGRGMNLGFGAQYRFTLVPGWDAGVFLDYNHQSVELTDPDRPWGDTEGAIGTLSIGVTVGTLL